jgi:hypothetical protein
MFFFSYRPIGTELSGCRVDAFWVMLSTIGNVRQCIFILICVGISFFNHCSIQVLHNSTLEGQIFALFWNGSFHTLTKVHANLRCHLVILKQYLLLLSLILFHVAQWDIVGTQQ